MKLEERVELERLTRLHELLEAKDDRQIRNQGRSDRLVGRNWRLACYVVGDVVGQREWDILLDKIGQRHYRRRECACEGQRRRREMVGWRDGGGR